MKIESPAIRKGNAVWTGKNHSEILIKAKGSLKGCEQGFITDKGGFVDRKEALKIATEAKQVNLDTVRGGILMSEDLYPELLDKALIDA
jgi:hypothetical protein